VNCAGLENALDDAVAGDIIELNESCADQSFNVSDMPGTAGSPVTLRGATGTEELNGGGAPGTRIFTGTDVRHLIVSQLTFRNGFANAANGGAMSVTGDSALTLDQVTFLGNHADGTGGAVFTTDTNATDTGGPVVRFSHFGDPNDPDNIDNMNESGGNGGALAIQTVSDSSVLNTTFDGNLAQGSGGAIYMQDTNAPGPQIRLDWFDNPIFFNHSFVAGGGVYIDGGQGSSLVSGNQVIGNSVDEVVNLTGRSPLRAQAVADGDHFGGGAVMEYANGTVNQQRNTFQGNSIADQNDAMDYGGGGEWVSGANVTSLRDRFLANQLPDVSGSGENEGGGLGFVRGAGTTTKVLDAFDLVAAGNQVGSGGGEGGGVYVGGGCPIGCETRFELTNGTVAGNQIAGDGQGAGIAGGLAGDELIMHNSIVFGNTGPAPEIEGFLSTSVAYSDACNSGVAYPGTANLCADPLLVDPEGLDIHETGPSPTVDKGNDAFIESDSGQDEDFEGDARSTDGDGDGHTVDIGADESPAFVAQPPPPPTKEQCADGKDNDNDGAIDLADPGCASAADNNEGDESLSALLLCGSRVISLVRADAVGKKAVLTGVVAAKYAGKKVAIYANYGAKGGLKKVATVKAGSSGSFKARLKLPSKKRFNKVRFQARIAGAKSARLKLPQSLASSSVKHKGAKLELRGTVKRTLLGKRNVVIVRRLTCGHYTKVGQAKPSKTGKYVVRFNAPAGSTAALYRAETRTLNKPRGKKYVKQYARAIGITLVK
jgi:predicted outer membrane repeat protein